MITSLLAALGTLQAMLFAPQIQPLPPEVQAAMTGTSWREGCPVGLDELRLVWVPHLVAEGETRMGRLILHQDHAQAVAGVFVQLHEAGFLVPSLRPAYEFGGDDDAMMRANNTSAFNCRPIAGTSTWSEHAWGHALDLNPLWNPYVRGERVDPPEGRPFVSREAGRVGTVVPGDAVVAAFGAIGWRWGGTWSRAQDYQHFSSTGR
mgnify:CR=1 FL=1